MSATRREAIRRGLILAGGVLPGFALARSAVAQEQASLNDSGIVAGLIGLGQTAVVAYRSDAGKSLGEVAELFAGQEQQHVDALSKALEDLDGEVPKPPLPDDIPGLTEVSGRAQMLNFAVKLENQLVAAYFDAARTLENPDLLSAVLEIVPNTGQHLVVLRQALGSEPVPSAFPSGSEGK